MSKYLVFSIAVWATIFQAVPTQECRTNSDCPQWDSTEYCCGGLFGDTKRTCTFINCLYHHCQTDSDCSDPTLCCRSNKCVKAGCSGCTSDSNCDSGQYCCKKTFPLNQTVCGANCIDESCNSNDDCGGYGECCRSNKCVYSDSLGCNGCTANSECNLGQYCCKKQRNSQFDQDIRGSCSYSCSGQVCGSDDDCGPPDECCRSNVCVKRGCSGCTSNANCSIGQYCCKKRQWYEQSECAADCIGKSCRSSHDCGGPGESCNSNNRCTKTNFPPWSIVVMVASLVVLIIFVTVIVLVFLWRRKRTQPAATTPSNEPSVPLLDAGLPQRNEPSVQNSPHNNQPLAFANPMQQPGAGFENSPHSNRGYDVQGQNADPNNSFYHTQQIPNIIQNPQYECGDRQVSNTWNYVNNNRALPPYPSAATTPSQSQDNSQLLSPPYNPQYVSMSSTGPYDGPPPPYVD